MRSAYKLTIPAAVLPAALAHMAFGETVATAIAFFGIVLGVLWVAFPRMKMDV